MIMFIVRFAQLDGSPTTIYCDIKAAATLASAFERDKYCIEFKCFYEDIQVVAIPASQYVPTKLVRQFDFRKNR